MKELPIYAYKRPEEMDHPCAEPHPVVVVGAGVTGLTMALDLARRICRNAPLGIRATKEAALKYLEGGEQAAIACIPQIREKVFASEDFKEGIQSFIERREARFQGR